MTSTLITVLIAFLIVLVLDAVMQSGQPRR